MNSRPLFVVCLNGTDWSLVTDGQFAARYAPELLLHDDKVWLIGGIQSSGNFQADVWYSELETGALALAGDTLAFGVHDVTDGPATPQLVELTNPGNAALTFSEISISGIDADQFSFAAPPDASPLAPGSSRQLALGFDPDLPGAKSAELRIISSDSLSSTQTVALSGTGVARPATAFNAVRVQRGGALVTGPLATLADVDESSTTLSVSVTGAPVGLSFAVSNHGGIVEATVQADAGLALGTYPMTLAVEDATGQQASGAFNVTVTDQAEQTGISFDWQLFE